MNSSSIETYKPRVTVNRGVWDLGNIQFKVYDLLSDGKNVTEEMLETALSFLHDEVIADAEKMGDNNGLGFLIIHPGDLGLTIAAQWWAQGSVLCQRIYRRQYNAAIPLDTINRPVVACVWELEIIAAEQSIWRKTMMNPSYDKSAYLNTRAS